MSLATPVLTALFIFFSPTLEAAPAALTRGALAASLASSRPQSAQLIPVLGQLRALDTAGRKTLFADDAVQRALSARILSVAAAAKAENAPLGEVQDALHELQLISRELGDVLPAGIADTLASARRDAARALEQRVSSAMETASSALREQQPDPESAAVLMPENGRGAAPLSVSLAGRRRESPEEPGTDLSAQYAALAKAAGHIAV